MNELAVAVRRHRTTVLGLSQVAAAEQLGFTQAKLSRIELGSSSIRSPQDLKVIADWLGISVDRAVKLAESPVGTEKGVLDLQQQLSASTEALTELLRGLTAAVDRHTGTVGDLREQLDVVAAMNRDLLEDAEPGSKAIGRCLRAKRQHLQMTLTDVARLFGCSASTVGWMEIGVFHPWRYVEQLHRFLEIPVDELEAVMAAESEEEMRSSIANVERRLVMQSWVNESLETALSRAESVMGILEAEETSEVEQIVTGEEARNE